MKSLLYICIFLCSLSANGQEVTSSYIVSSMVSGGDPETFQSTHNEMFHLMYGNAVYDEQREINVALRRFTSLFDENPASELIYMTNSPSGHVMTIATVEAGGSQHAVLSAFRNHQNILKKEFEYIFVISDQEPVDMDLINSRRDLWVEHSNNNRPDLVVNEVYAEDAYYLNRGKLLNDQASIIKEYGYMLNPGWSIQLFAEGTLQVNNRTIIEIGTYANGQGQYLLIWRLQDDDSWKIALDFNF